MTKQNTELQFDVFINHRGTDVKKNLANVIYHQLKAKDPYLRVFLDEKSIPCGVDFALAIETAIQSSSVHIAIFSEGYAESKWCLHELDLIIESKGKLIPVFCDVDPAALRRIEKGCYRKSFEKHRGREAVEKTKRWEDALARAADRQGLSLKMKEANLGDFAEKIARIVLNLINGSLVETTNPEAVDQTVEDSPASAPVLVDLEVCQEFMTEEFALAALPHDDMPDVSELFQTEGRAISDLFEADEDGPAMFDLDVDGLALSDLV